MLLFPVTGVLLAGGQSSRMGFPKGHILFKGRTLAERAYDLLASTCSEILLSASHTLYNNLPVKTIPDEFIDAGPLGGLCSAMKAASFPQIFVLPVDLPFIEEVHMRHILSAATHSELPVIPVHPNGKTEPLCAVYPTAAYTLALQLLKNGQYKVTGLPDRLGFTPLPVSDFPEYHDLLFFNVNTPEDLHRLNLL